MPSQNKQTQRKKTNRKYKTLIKNGVKTFNAKLSENNLTELASQISKIQKYADKAVRKGILSESRARRIKSRVQARFQQVSSENKDKSKV